MTDNIKDMLYELIGVQSDTGTRMEISMADKVYEIIGRQPYFVNNPDLYGQYCDGDALERPVVWALHKGKGSRTVIVTGHYDAVEIDSYGSLKQWALKPDLLKEKLKYLDVGADALEDAEDADWVFGRGSNDMKAGIAIDIAMVSEGDDELNVLMVAVPDEENLSAGMRQAVKLIKDVKERFDLTYKLVIMTEPHMRKSDDTFKISVGTVGKIMPAVVARGRIAHGSDVMEGLNSTMMMSNIIRRLELNPSLCSEDKGMVTPPPTVLCARDLKEIYDVSVPEYSAMYMNYQFLKSVSPTDIMNNIMNACQEAMEETIESYDRACKEMAAKGAMEGKNTRSYKLSVHTYEEMAEIASSTNSEYAVQKKALDEYIKKSVDSGSMSIQDAGIAMLRGIIELSRTTEPVIVAGFIPPYYPPANNSYLGGSTEYIEDTIRLKLRESFGLKLETEPYFMGICDLSYTACTDRQAEEYVMQNMVTLPEIYSIPFEYMEALSVPSVVLGPWGKDYHTITERVHMPDVEITVPQLMRSLIRQCSQQ